MKEKQEKQFYKSSFNIHCLCEPKSTILVASSSHTINADKSESQPRVDICLFVRNQCSEMQFPMTRGVVQILFSKPSS